jgi:two-component system response regulator NreC
VDDHSVVRSGIRALLELQPGWKVVAEASNGKEAIAKAIRFAPDLVIVDLTMPGLNGLEAARRILQQLPSTRVLILTMHDAEEFIERALEAGAHGYVLKSDAEENLVAAVKALLNNQTYFTDVASEIVKAGLRGRRTRKQLAPTPRETEVIRLLAEGKTNKEVARVLGISQRTAENHRAKIMEKLGLKSLSELVRYAVRNEIVEL